MAIYSGKRPYGINFGGMWVYNPPEPAAHVTNLIGIPGYQRTVPAGQCTCIPGAYYIDLGDGSGTLPNSLLFGEHTMRLQHGPLLVEEFAVEVDLAVFTTPPAEPPFANFLPWMLYYGKLQTDNGKYTVNVFPAGNAWYLVGGTSGLGDSGPFDVYMMWNPLADENAVSRDTFDQLRPNVFRFVEPHGGGAPETGNEFVTIYPYYGILP